jgi:hypothetical protein
MQPEGEFQARPAIGAAVERGAEQGSQRAEGGGDLILEGCRRGPGVIDVHGGDPNGTGAAFSKSIEVAKAIIAALH